MKDSHLGDVPLNAVLLWIWFYRSFYAKIVYCHVQTDKYVTCDDYLKWQTGIDVSADKIKNVLFI